MLDRWVFMYLTFDRDRTLWNAEWWQVFRQAGSLIPWAFVAAAFILHDLHVLERRRRGGEDQRGARIAFLHRGLMVFLAAGVGGLFSEILKGVIQRGRPIGLGVYRFGWVEEVKGYGLASSHVSVTFGAAFMLARFFPGTLLPMFALACGTAYTRFTPGAHYVSDLYVAAVMSWLATRLLWRYLGRFPGGHAHRVTLVHKPESGARL
jgi:membrane-associated phospholipid phosphatase